MQASGGIAIINTFDYETQFPQELKRAAAHFVSVRPHDGLGGLLEAGVFSLQLFLY